MKKVFIVGILSVFLLSGCIISIDDENGWDTHSSSKSWSQLEKDNRESISTLQRDVSVPSVLSKMGVPEFDELVVVDSKEYRVLYYRTQKNAGDGVTTKDECTPIVFEDGKLKGFGQLALDFL